MVFLYLRTHDLNFVSASFLGMSIYETPIKIPSQQSDKKIKLNCSIPRGMNGVVEIIDKNQMGAMNKPRPPKRGEKTVSPFAYR